MQSPPRIGPDPHGALSTAVLATTSDLASHEPLVDAPERPRPQHLHLEALRRPLEPKQYTSLAFGRRCRQAGIAQSMGSTGDAYDNAMAESFFASLETELLDRTSFRTRADARLAVFDYIEVFYNRIRRHSALDYLSPADFERRYRSTTISAA